MFHGELYAPSRPVLPSTVTVIDIAVFGMTPLTPSRHHS
jgi:hypothetical protein